MDGQAVKETPVIKFLEGELTGVRPVLAQDLEAVVHLLNESPLPFGENVPWTVARLTKKFEDEKEPGLWGKEKRWLVAVDNASSQICGLIKEDHGRSGEAWVHVHFTEQLPNRRELFLDGMRAFVKYKSDFGGVARVNIELLNVETDKLAWLEELGFIQQARVPQVALYLGERRDYILCSWIPEWVLARRAPDGGAKE